LDGLLPRGDNGYFMGQHQLQFVEQALMLMSQLDPGNQVFLVGTTNHIDNIDPRVAPRRKIYRENRNRRARRPELLAPH
jgi:SpoVK/Ycf46/Vps4 family AAA+-type ATPase